MGKLHFFVIEYFQRLSNQAGFAYPENEKT